MRIFVLILMVMVFPFSARAEEDCRDVLRAYIAGPLAVVRHMADYKAAMDAGYAACTVLYPDEFSALGDVTDFMQANMDGELEQGREVLDYLIDKPDDKKIAKSCAEDEEARDAVKKDVHMLLDGQYDKAYARRHKMLSRSDLVNAEQDSCLIVRDMVKQYDAHYKDYEQLQYVLYESSKKQGKKAGAVDRRAYKNFEKTRKALGD